MGVEVTEADRARLQDLMPEGVVLATKEVDGQTQLEIRIEIDRERSSVHLLISAIEILNDDGTPHSIDEKLGGIKSFAKQLAGIGFKIGIDFEAALASNDEYVFSVFEPNDTLIRKSMGTDGVTEYEIQMEKKYTVLETIYEKKGKWYTRKDNQHVGNNFNKAVSRVISNSFRSLID